MPAQAVYCLVIPGFADWEPAHALAELRRHGGYRVEVVSLDGAPVESMGGLRVSPNRPLAEVDPADIAVFILPGGDYWEQVPLDPALATLLTRLTDAEVPIAAICAATTMLARIDLLRGRRHTSNSLTYLKRQVPTYADAAHYVDLPAVRDRHLITASGLGDVEFAREIMAELDVLNETNRDYWSRMFRSGRVEPLPQQPSK